jgi:DNA polymerase III subunit beta
LKVQFSRENLVAKLQTVGRATAPRGAIQALSGILIRAEGDKAHLAATDAQLAIQAQLEADVSEPGSALVPGRLLSDILRVVDKDEVNVEHSAESKELVITSGQARFQLRSLPVEDFPRLPEPVQDGAVSLPAPLFSRTVERVVRAASRDDTRPVLTGVLVSASERELRMVATDSYRLSVKETTLENALEKEFEANVPARALQEVSRIVRETSAGRVSAESRENQIVFLVDETVVSSRMIEGQFPNYRQLLPENYDHELRLDKGEFLAVVRRVGLMAQRNAPLRLTFEQGSVAVSAQTADVGEAAETLPLSYEGERLEIGFNPQFLQDGLESIDAEELTLKLINPLRPGLLEVEPSDGESEQLGRFLYLIMPVRLNV